MYVGEEALNDEVKPQRLTEFSYANNSPTFWVPCWTTIPPSPVEVEPEANNTNLSATSKLVVFWNDAVPCTIKLFVITALPVTDNVLVTPSNDKLLSPLIVPVFVAVNILLSALLVIALVRLLTDAAYEADVAGLVLVNIFPFTY